MQCNFSQIPLSLSHTPSYRYEDFVIGTANHSAFRWLKSWPNWPMPFKGLNIYGPAGSGKTHLSHMFEDKNATTPTPTRLTPLSQHDDISAYQHVILDNFDGDDVFESEYVFHLFNHIQNVAGTLVIFSQNPVAQMQIALPDLRSRLRTLTAEELLSPDDDLLVAILAKLFADRQYVASDGILRYLVRRMDRQYSAAQTLVEQIDRYALAGNKPVNLALVRAVFETASQKTFDFTKPIEER